MLLVRKLFRNLQALWMYNATQAMNVQAYFWLEGQNWVCSQIPIAKIICIYICTDYIYIYIYVYVHE